MAWDASRRFEIHRTDVRASLHFNGYDAYEDGSDGLATTTDVFLPDVHARQRTAGLPRTPIHRYLPTQSAKNVIETLGP